MFKMIVKRVLLALTFPAVLVTSAGAQHQDVVRPAEWQDLTFGGRFMDRFEPMPLLGPRTGDTWGADAVKPRDVLNGIEDAQWSYWGGNIVEADDRTYHLFVCRWREDSPKGHMAWPQSEVVRAVAKNRMGPYKVAEVIGPGHNPEAYRLKDGRYVCYVMGAYYLGSTLTGPWEREKFEFVARDRKIVAGLSNLSFSRREDGSYLMVNRGGGMWVSRDGLSPWEQVTQGSNYPKVKGRFEDPVLWRTNVQYHMIVNDWHGRIAYHLRSKNGIHWKVDAGEAYMPGIAVSEDGKEDEWYKYERIKMFLDEHGRAVQANFAVIDYSKWEDKPNDIHSSKNISIPLTTGRLLTILNRTRITDDTDEIQVRIAAEPGFDPQKGIKLGTLRFGAPEEVDYGRGRRLLRTVPDGQDLIAVFSGRSNSFAEHNFAGKLLGRTSAGKLLLGYCRLPWVDYEEPILTVRRPRIAGQDGARVLRIEVSNHGQVASKPTEIRIETPDLPRITASCPALQPYGKTNFDVRLPGSVKGGQSYDLTITTGLHLQRPTIFTAEKVKVPPASGNSPKGKRPNFIFVLSDDIAQGDLGCYGQKLIETPRLDRMAAEGTRYLQAYCGTSVCAPSRASFFTGLHTGHCPVRGNYEVPPEGQLPLPERTVTIAEVAKSAGYATATFGKWGMGFFDSSGSPLNQGVDHFFGYNCQRHAHSYFPTYLYDDAQPLVLPGNDGQGVGKTYAQELIQNDMIRWLRKHADRPFLLFYAITLPHGRHEIDDYGIYRDKPWTNQQKAYAAQVTRVDSDMGELVDTLRELGIAERTLVIFSGDNGSSFSPQSEIGRLFDQASNGLRGFKRGMYEGALRQAAFAWWPGTVPAGRVDDQPWAFWDLMPTFVELSGATPPKGYQSDGTSLVEYLKGGDAPKRDYFYWELHRGDRPVQAARFGNFKAVRNGIDKPMEIYDLTADAAESKDLAKSRPDLVQKAQSIFKEAHRPDPNWPLERRSAAHAKSAAEAWKIKRWRDKTKWIPGNAVRMTESRSRK